MGPPAPEIRLGSSPESSRLKPDRRSLLVVGPVRPVVPDLRWKSLSGRTRGNGRDGLNGLADQDCACGESWLGACRRWGFHTNQRRASKFAQAGEDDGVLLSKTKHPAPAAHIERDADGAQCGA